MPISISSNAVIEKNKLTSNNTWLILLKIEYGNETPGYLCLNNEEVTWDGNTWTPALFSLGDIEETKEGEIPSIPLNVIDINRTLIPYIDQYDGGVGATVTIYIVNSGYLNNNTPEEKYETEVIDVNVDSNAKITFKLGAENLMKLRCSKDRYLKNQCRFTFKDSRCGYDGAETECNRTFTRCKELGNEARYGGFPGVGTIGVQV